MISKNLQIYKGNELGVRFPIRFIAFFRTVFSRWTQFPNVKTPLEKQGNIEGVQLCCKRIFPMSKKVFKLFNCERHQYMFMPVQDIFDCEYCNIERDNHEFFEGK